MRLAALGAVVATLLALAGGASAAEFSVSSGASLDLGTGSLDLGCADLSVAGTMAAGTVVSHPFTHTSCRSSWTMSTRSRWACMTRSMDL